MDPNDVSYVDEDPDEELLGKFRVASTSRPTRLVDASGGDVTGVSFH
jgi:hypothetical protein